MLKLRYHVFPARAIPEDVLDIIEEIHDEGYRGWIVGGAVRDLLIGKKPNDFDLVTDATPDQLKNLFGRRCVPIPASFRYVQIQGDHTNEWYDVATLRQEGYGGDINTYGTDIYEDLCRRNFTINAIYYDCRDNLLLSTPQAFQDLENRIIRTLGDSDAAFIQHPKHMLRAVRIAARLGCELTSEVTQSIRRHRNLIKRVDHMMRVKEVEKLLKYGSATRVPQLLEDHQLIDILMPHLLSFPKCWTHKFLSRLVATNQSGWSDTDQFNFLFGGLYLPAVKEEGERIQQRENGNSQRKHPSDAYLSELTSPLELSRKHRSQLIEVYTEMETWGGTKNSPARRLTDFWESLPSVASSTASKYDGLALSITAGVTLAVVGASLFKAFMNPTTGDSSSRRRSSQ